MGVCQSAGDKPDPQVTIGIKQRNERENENEYENDHENERENERENEDFVLSPHQEFVGRRNSVVHTVAKKGVVVHKILCYDQRSNRCLKRSASLMDSVSPLIRTVRESIVGDDEAMEGPFGVRRVVYADYTASGRQVSFIEDFIRHEVVPMYANTHTETSGTGLQTTRFRDQARELVLQSVGGDHDKDVVVFTGSGATAAIKKISDVLQLNIPPDLDAQYHLRDKIPANQRPVCFIGPFEHHSNELIWRHSIADVFEIDEDQNGQLDLGMLERMLIKYKDRPLKIGSFSAASNVTGIMTNVDKVAYLLHKHGALSFWDYAAAGPYVPILMNGPVEYCGSFSHPATKNEDGSYVAASDKWTPDELKLIYKDAIFISPHKFPGGPGTPGVLVAKRQVFKNSVPSIPGGGTVSFVSPCAQRYLSSVEHREEGGTPAIIESIRCGLVFQLKSAVGGLEIMEVERHHLEFALKRWKENPNIHVVGNPGVMRLSIVSLFIKYRGGPLMLHHNFVVALLNDLFGLQARGGCSCAGPYGLRLLDVHKDEVQRLMGMIEEGFDVVKPGWVRVNFNYFISDTVMEFIVDAIDFVATHGWKLMPYYKMNPKTGEFHHRARLRGIFDRYLGNLHRIKYEDGQLCYKSQHKQLPEDVLPTYLEEAHKIVEGAVVALQGWQISEAERHEVDARVYNRRHFVLPYEALDDLQMNVDIDHRDEHEERYEAIGALAGNVGPAVFRIIKRKLKEPESCPMPSSPSIGPASIGSDEEAKERKVDDDVGVLGGGVGGIAKDNEDDDGEGDDRDHMILSPSHIKLPATNIHARNYPLRPEELFERRTDILPYSEDDPAAGAGNNGEDGDVVVQQPKRAGDVPKKKKVRKGGGKTGPIKRSASTSLMHQKKKQQEKQRAKQSKSNRQPSPKSTKSSVSSPGQRSSRSPKLGPRANSASNVRSSSPKRRNSNSSKKQ